MRSTCKNMVTVLKVLFRPLVLFTTLQKLAPYPQIFSLCVFIHRCRRNPRHCRYPSADDHCRMSCEHGFQRDSGCEICQCKEPCPSFQCYRFCEFGFKTDANDCNICKYSYVCESRTSQTG